MVVSGRRGGGPAAGAALALALLGAAAGAGAQSAARPPAHWQPAAARPSSAAQRVLDSLPEPATVKLPADIGVRPAALPGGAGAPGGAAAPGVGYAPGACYEVQLAASAEAEAAQRMADAAAVRFGVPTRVVAAGGLHRVRAGDCLDGAAAAALRDRARAAGYPGAFLTGAR